MTPQLRGRFAETTPRNRAMTELVLDASVAVALVTNEVGSAAAKDAIQGAATLVPDNFWAEVARALARKVSQGDLDRQAAGKALVLLDRLVDRTVATRPLAPLALEVSLDLGHPLYDCLYLVAAVSEHAVVVTGDRMLCRRAERAGLGELVRLVKPD